MLRKSLIIFALLWSVGSPLDVVVAEEKITPPKTQPSGGDDEGVPDIKLGKEFAKHRKPRAGAMKGAKTNPTDSADEEPSVARKVLLFIPNRILDLIDVFKVDVGVGPTFGAVARITEYAQVGMRSVAPVSLRVGLMGRNPPIMAETSTEYGIGPAYVESTDREIGKGEVGAGVDLFLVGAYAGVDFYQIPDFFLGFFGVDYAEDDLS